MLPMSKHMLLHLVRHAPFSSPITALFASLPPSGPLAFLPFLCLELAIEHQSQTVLDSGELRGLLNTLNPKLDDYSKNMLLHGITRCVYLLDNEVRLQNCMM